MQNKSSLFATLAKCAFILALVSLFLPFVSLNLSIFGNHSLSGIQFMLSAIKNEAVQASLSLLCPIFGILGIISAFKFAGSGRDKVPALGVASAILGILLMVIAMYDGSYTYDIIVPINYPGAGFYIYVIMNLAAVAMFIASVHAEKNNG